MLLFLDFDGVLHPVSRPDGVLTLRPRLERILRSHPGVEVVISSAWRTEFPLPVLQRFFSTDIRPRIIGTTPIMGYPLDADYSRFAEINAWLQDAGCNHDAPWIAIDDSPQYFPPGLANLICCDPDVGIDDAVEAELRLRLQP